MDLVKGCAQHLINKVVRLAHQGHHSVHVHPVFACKQVQLLLQQPKRQQHAVRSLDPDVVGLAKINIQPEKNGQIQD